MIQIGNYYENENVKTIYDNADVGLKILEMQRDLSVSKDDAVREYFSAEMDVRKRQAAISLNGNVWTVSAGAMQMMLGNVECKTGVKGGVDLLKKSFAGAVTGERGIKPEYFGTGTLILEPTYKHLIVENVAQWGSGLVMNDGMYYASVGLQVGVQPIQSLSGALGGGEGLFNLMVTGNGLVIMESMCPKDELVYVNMKDDVLKVDGNYAVCWSPSLQFTVERTTKTLIGSAASGEGLVNVYRGTGTVLLALI